jgi:hypothetical protein
LVGVSKARVKKSKKRMRVDNGRTYATIAIEMEANVTAIWSQARNVLSFAKNTFGSTLTGTFRGFSRGPGLFTF